MAEVDDWDAHWSAYGGAAAACNPAVAMRERLVTDLLGPVPSGSTVVDIGSGQGALALALAARYPEATVVGIEYSAEGVRRATEAAQQCGAHARFLERDLLQPAPDEEAASVGAGYGVCSEVLEHVDDPAALLRHGAAYLRPGSPIVITVPGGPRSAFDKHLGHRRHFTPAGLADVIERAGLDTVRVARAGFPFFNLYKCMVIARGAQVTSDVGDGATDHRSLVGTVLRGFDALFRYNLPPGRLGWQIVGVARRP